MTAKEEFIEIYNQYINRKGADELLEWIERTDFFTAPASTRYHCSCEGGLVMHSVSVFNTMMEKHFDEETDSIESFAICALLHDLCKAQFYKVSTRNVKNEETYRAQNAPKARRGYGNPLAYGRVRRQKQQRHQPGIRRLPLSG